MAEVKATTQDGDHEVENKPAPTTSKTMKACRFHGKEDLRVEEVPEPTCGKGQVKVRPAWCGICGSDLHEYLVSSSSTLKVRPL